MSDVPIARHHWRAVGLAALAAGVLNLTLGLVGAALWAGDALFAAFRAMGYEPSPTPGMAVSHTLQRLAMGAIIAWLYVTVARGSDTPRAGTVATATATSWLALYVTSMWLMAGWQIVPWSLAAAAAGWGLAESLACTVAAARVYHVVARRLPAEMPRSD